MFCPELFSSRLVPQLELEQRFCVEIWPCPKKHPAQSRAQPSPAAEGTASSTASAWDAKAKAREAKWKVERCQWNTEPSPSGRGSNVPYNLREEVTHRGPGLPVLPWGKIMESLMLEKPSQAIEPKHHPSSTLFTTEPWPQGPHPQRWGLPHCPGQPLPMPEHSFSEKFLSTSKPPLA